jgi:hypothetical protein
MASTITKTVDEATDQVVSLIEQAQEAAASVVRSASETVAQYVPELGLGETLLSPEDVVDTSFKVGAKFMNAGRDAALGIVKALQPINQKIFGTKSTPKAVAKSA